MFISLMGDISGRQDVQAGAGLGGQHLGPPRLIGGIHPLFAGGDEAHDSRRRPVLLAGLGVEAKHAAKLGADVDAIVDHGGRFQNRLGGGELPQHLAALLQDGIHPAVARSRIDHAHVAVNVRIGRQIGRPRYYVRIGLQLMLHDQGGRIAAIYPAEAHYAAIGGPDDILFLAILQSHQRLHQGSTRRLAGHRRDILLAESQILAAVGFFGGLLLGSHVLLYFTQFPARIGQRLQAIGDDHASDHGDIGELMAQSGTGAGRRPPGFSKSTSPVYRLQTKSREPLTVASRSELTSGVMLGCSGRPIIFDQS